MKVLFLTNIPSPYRVDFFSELGKKCDLTVLFEFKNVNYREDSWISNEFANFKHIFLSNDERSIGDEINFSVLKYLKKNIYDFIIISGYNTKTSILAIEYMRLKKIPFILSVDGINFKNESLIKYKFKKRLISSASAWLSTGKKANENLFKYGAKEENTFIYPFTAIKDEEIINSYYSQQEINKKKNMLGLSNKKIILGVGRFVQVKCFDNLIRSFSKLKKDEWQLILIGNGPEKEKYDHIIKNKKINNIKILEFMNKKELIKYYRVSDLFVLPSNDEVWGLVINEAMAQGIPVISTNKCGAALEMININKNGYIYKANNEEELYGKIFTFTNLSEDEVNDMKLFSIKVARKYTIEKMAEKHIEILNLLRRKLNG
ncbi:glycosyltransferase family 4 protein [Clostridium perfringens]|uniref:glycosyltransferase family 4 protein n=1 Tax=Clostridium perfringens TaxID=1502 RepID=UPI001C856CA1|nr:glycosyltransferase [Clostridium perfringens]ELC8389846.1 glycosyltransferase [Clostridium perfringens]